MMRWLQGLQPVFLVVALLFLGALIYGQWDNPVSYTHLRAH